MRLLLYGMQSSGATSIAFALAQRRASLAFTDIWNMYAAPELESALDALAKVVVTTAYPLEVHKARFKPDLTVLVLRDPVATFESLARKPYVNENGLINEKFRLLEKTLVEKNGFDFVLHYEDFVFAPDRLLSFAARIGWALPEDALRYPRQMPEIATFNAAHCPGLDGRLGYGLGAYRREFMVDVHRFLPKVSERAARLRRLCPRLCALYDELRAERGALWHVPEPAFAAHGLEPYLAILAGAEPEMIARAEAAGISGGVSPAGAGLDFAAGKLLLTPSLGGGETRLHLAGLPGAPFNRLRGVVSAGIGNAAPARAGLRIFDGQNQLLAQAEFMLEPGRLMFLDLPYAPPPGTVGLALAVSGDATVLTFESLALAVRAG